MKTSLIEAKIAKAHSVLAIASMPPELRLEIAYQHLSQARRQRRAVTVLRAVDQVCGAERVERNLLDSERTGVIFAARSSQDHVTWASVG